jgi:hypothetical protein
MKVIFLDIDGVLNSMSFYWKCDPTAPGGGVYRRKEGWLREHPPIDPEAVKHLNEIIDRSAAVVCISSSWRKLMPLNDLENYLEGCGIRINCVGSTPDFFRDRADWFERVAPMRPIERGDEIKAWLDSHSFPVSHYVVLDDDSDMTAVADHFVQTDFDHGLLAEHVTRALAILGAE